MKLGTVIVYREVLCGIEFEVKRSTMKVTVAKNRHMLPFVDFQMITSVRDD